MPGTLVLTILRLAGQAAALYDTATGAWLLASASIAMLVFIVWRAGWSIERTDVERRAMAKELKRLSDRDSLTSLYNRRPLREIRVPAGNTTVTPAASIGALACLPPGDKAWTPESVLSAGKSAAICGQGRGPGRASHRSLALAIGLPTDATPS